MGISREWHLDALVTGLSVVMVTGVVLDFRAHAEGMSFAEEGFVTPEHATFYTAFLGIAAVIGGVTYRNRRAGRTWVEAVPAGYALGVLGVLLFGLGGVGDFFWHSTFGFEQGIEALVSPTHLMLASGGVLFLSSPLRSMWDPADDPTGLTVVPALISAALTLMVVSLFSLFVNPLSYPRMVTAEWPLTQLGLAEVVSFAAILVGSGMILSRRFRLPPGALTFIFGLMGLASSMVGGNLVLALPAVAAGLCGDAILRLGQPTAENPLVLRGFGTVVGLGFAGSYVAVIMSQFRMAWTVHMWTGAIVLAGIAGLLVTYVVTPDSTRAANA